MSESVQSSSGVFIQWASPPPPDVNGIIRSYTVNLLNTRTGAVLSYSTTQTSINITNLSPYTQYQYNVSAVTVSEGPFSISLNFTTYQDGNHKCIHIDLQYIHYPMSLQCQRVLLKISMFQLLPPPPFFCIGILPAFHLLMESSRATL